MASPSFHRLFYLLDPLPASHLFILSPSTHPLYRSRRPAVILPRFELALLASQLLILLFQPLKACPLCVRFDQKLFAAVLQHVRVLFVLLSSVLVRSPLELPLVLDFEALLRLIHYFHLHHLLLGVALFPHFILLFPVLASEPAGQRASSNSEQPACL
ncbi:hypothetical protein BLNAU_7878 [Blattamonas nauphoetae]|uniref:Transmembrane protein n=1 Tax=Blattamonas nauphoetae TaxID=2049346 RepID=A0ABQ9XZW9_9EUKA|nr:hypothetical protein BLNAU_7878 [Blattamonas nauphoetae]